MKTKKKSVKKSGVTAGKVFGRIVKEAKFFDYMVVEPGQNPWDNEFIGFTQIDNYIVNVDEDRVVIHDLMSCRSSHPATIKGDTVEVVDGDFIYLFRFYGEPPRLDPKGMAG